MEQAEKINQWINKAILIMDLNGIRQAVSVG